MYRSDNPVRDAEFWIDKQERKAEETIICDCCERVLEDEDYFDLPPNGFVLCELCLERYRYRA